MKLKTDDNGNSLHMEGNQLHLHRGRDGSFVHVANINKQAGRLEFNRHRSNDYSNHFGGYSFNSGVLKMAEVLHSVLIVEADGEGDNRLVLANYIIPISVLFREGVTPKGLEGFDELVYISREKLKHYKIT